MNARSRFSRLVRSLRGSATQKEFAKLFGVTYAAVQSWEGKDGLATVDPDLIQFRHARKIAELKSISLDDLAAEIDEARPDISDFSSLLSRVDRLPPSQALIVAKRAIEVAIQSKPKSSFYDLLVSRMVELEMTNPEFAEYLEMSELWLSDCLAGLPVELDGAMAIKLAPKLGISVKKMAELIQSSHPNPRDRALDASTF